MNETLKKFVNDQGKLLGYAVVAVLVLLALFLLAKTVDAFDRMGKSPYAGPNVVTVTGTGKAETPPTIAHVVFTVQETAGTVAEAQDAASRKATAALDAIRALGIEDKDVQAAGYQTNPQYETLQPCRPGFPCVQGSPKIVGYQVSQTVTVKIRNTDLAAGVLAALGTAGVQNTTGPDFQVDDDSEVMEEARGKAIEVAREKAHILAKQLHVRLGDVVSFSENGDAMPMYESMNKAFGGVAMDMAARPAVPLPQGQNESVVNVSITYEIK
ncbi:MAG: uncharacterized protein QOE22_483 [Candidatus Parcubacteria bacterium]|jgi:uncharacterized protein YggE|nr:uncharacterized protein [Candidatus Parcubacteria bacterium]